MGNVVVKQAYLDLLKAGVSMEHLNMYAAQNNVGDARYKVPKEEPKASEELINKTIAETEIYRRAKLAILQSQNEDSESYHRAKRDILQAQKKQVAYGIDKYPEPLNPNTWSIAETIDHIIDESIDKLHYSIMLRIKLEQSLMDGRTNNGNTRIWSTIDSVDNMIKETIEALYCLVILRNESEGTAGEGIMWDKKPIDNMMLFADGPAKTYNREDYLKDKQRGKKNEVDTLDALTYVLDNTKWILDKGIDMKNSDIVSMSGADMDGDTLRVFTEEELDKLAGTRVFTPSEHVLQEIEAMKAGLK